MKKSHGSLPVHSNLNKTDVLTLMSKKTEPLEKPTPKIHLRHIRLPNQVMDIYPALIYRSERVIVLRSRITSTHSVMFDGEVVLAPRFQIVVFELMGKWFSIGKIRNLQERHTGYYCDIGTPPRLLEDGGIELTDLFLDLWVSPDLRYKVLDEEELANALKKRWIAKQLHDKAKKELKKLIVAVKQKQFPPNAVSFLESKLCL